MGKKPVVGVKGRGETEAISPSLPPSVLKILSYLSRITSLVEEPVKVRVKDGSVFSGKFFAASMEGHGIVLNDAELIIKGGCKSNLAIGVVVKTLVVRPCHIVEVVSESKGITLLADDLSTNLHGDAIGAEGTVPSSESLHSEAKETTKPVEDKLSKNKSSQDEKTLKALKYYCECFLESMEAQGPKRRYIKDASEVTSANTTLSRGLKSNETSKAILNPKAKNLSPSSSPSPSTSMHVAGSHPRPGTGAYPPNPSPNLPQAAPHVFDEEDPDAVMNAPLLPVMQPMMQDEPEKELPISYFPDCMYCPNCGVPRAGSLCCRPGENKWDIDIKCCPVCKGWYSNIMLHILDHLRLPRALCAPSGFGVLTNAEAFVVFVALVLICLRRD